MSLNPNAMHAMVNALLKKQQKRQNKPGQKRPTLPSSRRPLMSNIHQQQPFTNNEQWATQQLLAQLRLVNRRAKRQINRNNANGNVVKRTVVTAIPRTLETFRTTMVDLEKKQANAFNKVEDLIRWIRHHPKLTDEEKYDLIFLYVLEPMRTVPKYAKFRYPGGVGGGSRVSGGGTFYDAMLKKYMVRIPPTKP
jgi:hypothetical protein